MRIQLASVLLGVGVIAGSTADAATFTVNVTAATYDGICNTNCSFKDAIQAANTNPGLDTIVLQTHATYTVAAATALQTITDSVIIQGHLATLDVVPPGSASGFVVAAGSLTVEDMTIRGANIGISNTGGGFTSVYNSIIERSSYTGMWILNGDASLLLTTIRYTTNGSQGGGIHFRDFGAGTPSTLQIQRSAIVGNNGTTGPGGGIKLEADVNAFISDTSIVDNIAGTGGGIDIHSVPITNTVSLINVTVAGNTASDGGGIYRSGCSPYATTCTIRVQPILENTIIANNNAPNNPQTYGEFVSNGQNIWGQLSPGFTSITGLVAQDAFLAGTLGGIGPTVTTGEAAGEAKRPVVTTGLPINFGDPATCSTSDQYQNARTPPATCESGAIELRTCTPPPADLADWWTMDQFGPSGEALDRALANNAGFINGSLTFSAGQVEGGVCFGGTGYLEANDHPDLDFPGPGCILDVGADPFSIDAWVRAPGDGLQMILDKREFRKGKPLGWALFSQNGGLGFQMATGDGNLACGTPFSGCTNYVAPASPIDLRDGRWHLVAVTVRRGCRLIPGGPNPPALGRLYVDGQLVLSFTPRNGDIENAASLLIGARHGVGIAAPRTPSDLCADEVEIFKRELAQSEIQAIYDADWGGKCRRSIIIGDPADATTNVSAADDTVVEGTADQFTYSEGVVAADGTAISDATAADGTAAADAVVGTDVYDETVMRQARELGHVDVASAREKLPETCDALPPDRKDGVCEVKGTP